MADVIDQANDYAEEVLSRALAGRVVFHGNSAKNCIECDCEIPLLRREAVPGVQLCIDCAEIKEARRG
ncbi:MAG: conjugal transfer protein TraR [Pseudomonadaceae bacterium]|nr:conjugal transfer protein TraR [Pseudomonadaceae bacterium]|tara:strand:+ start:1491 stop:1694 length:204 start_codon:yes stop_codon:yes gene_type:complete